MWTFFTILLIVFILYFVFRRTLASHIRPDCPKQEFAEWGAVVIESKSPHYEYPDKRFKTKVAGVTKRNKNRTSRQSILKKIRKAIDEDGFGPGISLIREPYNKFDCNAIAVIDDEDRQIGYIREGVAADLARQIDSGYRVVARIDEITGGEEGKETLGCLIEIDVYYMKS